MNNLYFRKF